MKATSPNPLVDKTKALQNLRDEQRREQLAKRDAQKQIDLTVANPKLSRADKEQDILAYRIRIDLITSSEKQQSEQIADLERELLEEYHGQSSRVHARLRQMATAAEKDFFAAIAPFYESETQARRVHRGIQLPMVQKLARDAMRFQRDNGHQGMPVEDQIASYLSNLVSMEKKYGWTE